MGSRFITGALCAFALVFCSLGAAAAPDASKLLLRNQAETLRADGRYPEARALAEKRLAAAEKAQPADDFETLWWLQELGVILQDQGLYTQAEPYLTRSLALAERLFEPGSAMLVTCLSNLAANEEGQGRFAEAEAHFKRAIAIGEHHNTDLGFVSALSNLGKLYVTLGRFAEAEPLYKRALAIAEALLGRDDRIVAVMVGNLGHLYWSQGRFAESEAHYLRGLRILERTVGPDHPSTANALGNLAVLYQSQGRFEEAEPLLLRSCGIFEKRLGPAHPMIAACAATTGSYLHQMKRYTLAEQFYRRALDVYSKLGASDTSETAQVLTNFGQLLIDTDRDAEAEAMLARAVSILEKTLGTEHPDTAKAMDALAISKVALGKFADAEAVLRRALNAARKALPSTHPDLEHILTGLSIVQFKRNNYEDAVALAREAAAIEVVSQALSATSELAGTSRSVQKHADAFAQEMRAAYALSRAQPGREQTLRDAAFGAAQYLTFDETGRAVGQMAARFAARNDPLGRLLHEQQDLLRQLRAVNQLIADAIGSPDPKMRGQSAALRQKAEAIAARLQQIDAQLRRENATYADLADPRPISLAETQSLLGGDEAMVLAVPALDATFLFAISRTQIVWTRVELRREKLEQLVLALRLQMDTSAWQGPLAPFNRSLAYELYQSLLAPLDAVIRDKSNLFIVATGPLTSMPFSILVTEPPAGGAKGDSDPVPLRNTSWLIKRQALTTLPSVSSLRALRVYADKRIGNEAFAGFGDPVFDAAAEERRRVRNLSRFFRGDQPKLEMLRTLPRLRATGDEVRAMARILGAPESDVYLRERATEAQIKSRDLSRKRIIEIATHGLVAGDLDYAEPGLALSPPGSATDLDDGYLASSEAARLNLHADLVILSACDTAAGEVPGANGLSGLARSFILAGTKSLLASHWPVDDRAAMLLTTRTVEAMQRDPTRGRAEALRQAMLSVMNEPGDPLYAHPAAWAPFVLIGETRAN